jgi:curved DNA-binding protein CbpA
MLNHYLILGLTPGATDQEIKNRFLDLVKKYPPEKEARMFRQINGAYEALKDHRRRIKAKMFHGMSILDIEAALLELAAALPVKKKRATFKDLVKFSANSRS